MAEPYATPDDLVDHRVLVLAILRDDPQEVAVYAGRARYSDDRLEISTELEQRSAICFEMPRDRFRTFPPSALPNLLVHGFSEVQRQRLNAVEACIPLFVDALPAGGLALRGALFGLATTGNGAPLLMKGDRQLAERLLRMQNQSSGR